MVASDAKYHLNFLTSLYGREKKMNCTHCDEPVEEQIMEGTLVFSFRNTASTKFEISTLTNQGAANFAVGISIVISIVSVEKQTFVTNYSSGIFKNGRR